MKHKRIEYLELIASLFTYKTIVDEAGNEYILFSGNPLDHVNNILDRTEFEAFQNHVHLIFDIKKSELNALVRIADSLGQALLYNLKSCYPEKHFMVFVTSHLHDSLIIRFHQKWENEEPFCNVDDFASSEEKVFLYEA